ncbi:hypothetical protein AVEN_10888-1 [Araneus ventricosus]|uniref:Uncharacterized protein n=1 Tax=Araneus ventricosus TaxID=182803 RepID=A0A4Y2WP44_ARAVE|nr:hypothetical protein AVEN_10888-1 [Araneus ventricosus]
MLPDTHHSAGSPSYNVRNSDTTWLDIYGVYQLRWNSQERKPWDIGILDASGLVWRKGMTNRIGILSGGESALFPQPPPPPDDVRKFGEGVPSEVSSRHQTAAQNYDVRPKIIT